jgi:hypothetical protein
MGPSVKKKYMASISGISVRKCRHFEIILIFIYNIPRDRYIAGNFFEQSSHTSVCSKKITRGRQPEGNFERQTRVLDCKKKFLAIYICPEVYSEENRPKKFFPRSIISEIFPRENFRLIKL